MDYPQILGLHTPSNDVLNIARVGCAWFFALEFIKRQEPLTRAVVTNKTNAFQIVRVTMYVGSSTAGPLEVPRKKLGQGRASTDRGETGSPNLVYPRFLLLFRAIVGSSCHATILEGGKNHSFIRMTIIDTTVANFKHATILHFTHRALKRPLSTCYQDQQQAKILRLRPRLPCQTLS